MTDFKKEAEKILSSLIEDEDIDNFETIYKRLEEHEVSIEYLENDYKKLNEKLTKITDLFTKYIDENSHSKKKSKKS